MFTGRRSWCIKVEGFFVLFTLPISREKDLSLGLARELPGRFFKVHYDKKRAGPQRRQKASFPKKAPFPGELPKLVEGGRVLVAKLGCAFSQSMLLGRPSGFYGFWRESMRCWGVEGIINV